MLIPVTTLSIVTSVMLDTKKKNNFESSVSFSLFSEIFAFGSRNIITVFSCFEQLIMEKCVFLKPISCRNDSSFDNVNVPLKA